MKSVFLNYYSESNTQIHYEMEYSILKHIWRNIFVPGVTRKTDFWWHFSRIFKQSIQ